MNYYNMPQIESAKSTFIELLSYTPPNPKIEQITGIFNENYKQILDDVLKILNSLQKILRDILQGEKHDESIFLNYDK